MRMRMRCRVPRYHAMGLRVARIEAASRRPSGEMGRRRCNVMEMLLFEVRAMEACGEVLRMGFAQCKSKPIEPSILQSSMFFCTRASLVSIVDSIHPDHLYTSHNAKNLSKARHEPFTAHGNQTSICKLPTASRQRISSPITSA